MDTPASASTPQKRLQLPVLDGGGMRGIGMLSILQKLKRETDLNISEFDMISGTSMGGLITPATLLGLDLEEIEKLFVTIGQDIFTSSWMSTASYHAQKVLPSHCKDRWVTDYEPTF
jgi:patatin-like phospholipase/acyl hydrolase